MNHFLITSIRKETFKPTTTRASLPIQTINHTRNLGQTPPAKMPLVVPGINDAGAKTQGMDWQMKLMGKKIGDKTDELVS